MTLPVDVEELKEEDSSSSQFPRARQTTVINAGSPSSPPSSPSKRLYSVNEIEKFMQMPYIFTGYRPSSSLWESLSSLVELDNQSFNIWLHLLGSIGFLWLSWHCHERLSALGVLGVDYVLPIFNFLGAAFTMAASACYHTFLGRGLNWERALFQLDASGMLLTIFTSEMVGVLGGFPCDRKFAALYTLIMALLLTFAALLIFIPSLKIPATVQYLSLASCVIAYFVPAAHLYLTLPLDTEFRAYCMGTIFFGGCLFASGFILFMTRFPEVLLPGSVDLVGNSHNLWHFAIACAVYFWGYWSLDLIMMKYEAPSSAPLCLILAQTV